MQEWEEVVLCVRVCNVVAVGKVLYAWHSVSMQPSGTMVMTVLLGKMF